MAVDHSDMEGFPPDWPLRAVSEFAKVKGGKRLPAGTALVSSKTSHPYLRIVDFKDGRIDKSGLLYVPSEVFPRIARYTISSRDVYISIVGTIGLIGAVDDELDGANLTENAAKICEISSEVDRDYLISFLRSEWGQHQIRSLTVGSTQPKLALFRIADIAVPVPPLRIQRGITHILSTLDDKIELNRRMSETLEAIARALFKSWFVDFDPVRAKAEGRDPGLPQPLADLFPDSFQESKLGEIPREWALGNLGDVAEHSRRGVQPSGIAPDMPYIALEHMPKRSIALSEWGSAEGLESNKFEFRKGEILFGKLRPYFHKVGVAPVDGVCSTDIVVVAPRSRLWFGLVLGIVSSHEFVEYTNAGTTGTKMPRTSWAEMARYELVMPPEAVSEAFSARVRPLVDHVIAKTHESRTLALLRDTLLPNLVSGELSVSLAEARVP